MHTMSGALLSLGFLAAGMTSYAQNSHNDRKFWPGNLVVSRSVYDNNPKIGRAHV